MNTLLQPAGLLAAAVLAASCVAGAAVAAPIEPSAPVEVLVIVNAHGLDLSSPAGADAFLSRLDTAVNRACDDRPDGPTLSLRRSRSFVTCRTKALKTAMAEVRSPVVRQRYAELHREGDLRLARR